MSNDPVIPAGSRAILIGVPNYQDARYKSYPDVGNSVHGMYELLVDSGLCGWQPEQVIKIIDPDIASKPLSQLRRLARQATGVLLLYFVGHGVLSDQGELCLAISDTDPDDPESTGLEYTKIRRMLWDTPATTRIVILDSCYSGRAIGLGTIDGPTQLADLSAPDVGEGLKPGAYTLTAADNLAYVSPDADADAEGAKRVPPDAEDSERTAFTGELLDLLAREGIPGGPAGLTFGTIFPHLRLRLDTKGLPRPNQRADDQAADFVFARNAAVTPASESPSATSAESASTTVIAPPADTAQLLNERNTGDTGQLALAPDKLRTPPARSAAIPPSPVPSEEPESESPPDSKAKQRFSGFRRNRRRIVLAVTAGAAAGLSCALVPVFWPGPDTHHPTVAATIPLESFATSVAVDPATHHAYVVYGTSSVADINTTTNKIVTSIDIGEGEQGPIAINPANRTVYVGDTTTSAVSLINTVSDKITGTLRAGHETNAMAIDSDTRTAYFVTNFTQGSLNGTVTSRTANSVTRTIDLGYSPTAIAIDPDAHTAYVTGSDGSVSTINTISNKVTATVQVGGGSPNAIAVDPADHMAYVTNEDDNTVSVIDTSVSPITIRSVAATIRVGKKPSAIAVDPDTHTAYVANFNDNTVSVIDTTTNKVTATVHVGSNPISVAVDPDTHIAYVANESLYGADHGSLSVLKPS